MYAILITRKNRNARLLELFTNRYAATVVPGCQSQKYKWTEPPPGPGLGFRRSQVVEVEEQEAVVGNLKVQIVRHLKSSKDKPKQIKTAKTNEEQTKLIR